MHKNVRLPIAYHVIGHPEYSITCFLTAVRHEVNNLESSVVLQELELAIILAL